MIKVIHVLSDTNIGGAGTLLLNYLKNFNREKFIIKIILPKGSLLSKKIIDLGYNVIEVDAIKDKSMDIKAIKILIRIFKEEKPDIVHTHSSMSAKIAAYVLGIKSRIYTRHCVFSQPKYLTTFPGKYICGFINNTLSTKIIAVADAAKQNLLETGVKENKISVIINGVEPLKKIPPQQIKKIKQKYNVLENDFVFGIVARLEDIKGQEYFIKAAKQITKKYKNTKFIIAGTGSSEEKLKKLANKTKNIIFTGFIENVSEIFSIIDVNVNCSYGTETSSLALSEGMSLGKPIIASNYGGNPYMVTDGYNGFLFEKQNVEDLVNKMEKIYLDKKLYKNMSKNSLKNYNEKFTASKMTEQLELIYIEEYKK